jgi:outer membrane lipoprotein-sorting protein
MKRCATACAAVIVTLFVSGVAAAEGSPDGPTIAKRMQAALEPSRPSIRQLAIEVSAQHGENARWTAGQARKRINGRNQMVTVMLAPEDVQGISFLVQEGADGDTGDHTVHIYLPSLRRTRTLTGVSAYEAFLGSDFTYADLGFESMHATYSLLKSGEKNGAAAYEIQAVPVNRWYYQRIVSWVDEKTLLPIERTYYGPDNEIWKIESIERVTAINGVPTPLRFVMKDQEADGQTEIIVSGVRYDAEIPDTIFDPAALRDAVSSPLWQGLGR